MLAALLLSVLFSLNLRTLFTLTLHIRIGLDSALAKHLIAGFTECLLKNPHFDPSAINAGINRTKILKGALMRLDSPVRILNTFEKLNA